MASVEKVNDYLRVAGFGEDWMVLPRHERFTGYGLQGRWLWIRYQDGALEIHDVAARRPLGAVQVAAETKLFRTWHVPARDGRRLFVFDTDEGDTVTLRVLDLPSLRVVRTVPGLPGFIRHKPAERLDGRLVVVGFSRNDGQAQTSVLLVDPASGSRDGASLAEPAFDYPLQNHGFRDLSPDGRHLLRFDHTRLPRHVELSKGFFGLGRKPGVPLYGLTFQIWQVEPLRFLRRVEVAWLRPDELPDETHLSARDAHPEPLKARQAIWDAIADTAARLEAEPYAGGAPREAYPPGTDDALWNAIQKNLAKAAQDWGRAIHWQPDGEAFWVDVNGFLTCVGLDGTVSPRLYMERLGLRRGTWLPCAHNPRDVTPLDGRKLLGRFPEGRGLYDGAPAPRALAPQAIPTSADDWVDAAQLAEVAAREAAWKATYAMGEDRRRIVIPLAGGDEASVIAAIEVLIPLMDESLFRRASDSHVELVFKRGSQLIAEPDFFIAVRERFPGAVHALRRLVIAYVQACQPNRFLFSIGEDGAGFLANAVMSLGLLDRAALPVLQAYGLLVDAGHEYFFAGDTVPAVLKRHQWSDEALDFAFWVLIRNYYNTLQDYGGVWRAWGMREAAVRREPMALARHIVGTFGAELADSPHANAFGSGGLRQLARQIPAPHPPWETAFFGEVERLLGEALAPA